MGLRQTREANTYSSQAALIICGFGIRCFDYSWYPMDRKFSETPVNSKPVNPHKNATTQIGTIRTSLLTTISTT